MGHGFLDAFDGVDAVLEGGVGMHLTRHVEVALFRRFREPRDHWLAGRGCGPEGLAQGVAQRLPGVFVAAILFHFMIVCVVAGCPATPKTILTSD